MHASYELMILTKDGEVIDAAEGLRQEVLVRLTKLTGYQLAGYPGTRWEVLNWPDYIDHMKQISTVFKDVVFLLNRAGEMPGDLKKEYFYKGTHYSDTARIVFNERADSVRELLEAQKKQSAIGRLMQEYEQRTNLQADSIMEPRLKEAAGGF